MYVHLDDRSYKLARVGVFTSKRLDGNFEFLTSFRLLDKEGRDIRQFIDDDGSAYLVFESRLFGGSYNTKLWDGCLRVDNEVCLGCRRRLQSRYALKPMSTGRKVFEMRVSLRGTDPLVWREFGVPADYSINDLHEIIQIVMGWHNYHCHVFRIGGKEYSSDIGLEGVSSQSIQIATAFRKSPSGFEYVYDFGDTWCHDVTLIRSLKVPDDDPPPLCWDGAMASPPEDVGGIGGFAAFKQILANPDHEEHDKWQTWAGPTYRADCFSAKQATAGLIGWWRNRSCLEDFIASQRLGT
jgi:hypothetical protein